MTTYWVDGVINILYFDAATSTDDDMGVVCSQPKEVKKKTRRDDAVEIKKKTKSV